MTEIIVVAGTRENRDPAVLMRERVRVTDLESEHFADQLIERLGWALLDADDIERGEHGASRTVETPGTGPAAKLH